MSRTERTANLIGVVVPFAGVLVAVVLLWNRAVDVTDLALLAVTYLMTAVGITVGFHRLLTHRAFQTHAWLERMFAVLGSLSVQGSVMDWVADHRKHHAHTDREGDPHSPHVGHGSGLAGLWHAHVGWLFETQGQADWKRYAPELYEDPGDARDRPAASRCWPPCRCSSRRWPASPSTASRPAVPLRGLVWGGLVRIFLVHHVTWSVNSVCHFFGSPPLRRRGPLHQRRLAGRALARRVLASQPPRLPALGPPRAALVGDRPLGADHHGMERAGLAWNVVRIAPERQRARTLGRSRRLTAQPASGSRRRAVRAEPRDDQLGASGAEAGRARPR